MALKGVEKTVFRGNSDTVPLAKCLLEAENINPGVIDPNTHILTFNLKAQNQCGTLAEEMKGTITYINVIKMQNSSREKIIRHSKFRICFSCSYLKPVVAPKTFKIKDRSVVQTFTDGNWSFSVETNAFTDAAQRTSTDPNTELHPKVWVELGSDIRNNNLVHLVAKSCWATSEAAPDCAPRYSLITDGCSAEATVEVERNGKGTSNTFSYDMFQFIGRRGGIYLHSDLKLYDTPQGSSTQVIPGSKIRPRKLSFLGDSLHFT